MCSGSSTGQTATTRWTSMPAVLARAATRNEKLPPSENPGEVQPAIREHRVQAAYGADDLRDAARVENFLVQVMALAVVAQVQARDVVARFEQRLRKRQQVQRIRAAFPTVQQHGQAIRCGQAEIFLGRDVGEQSHAFAAIDDHLPRCGHEPRTTPHRLRRAASAGLGRSTAGDDAAAATAARTPGRTDHPVCPVLIRRSVRVHRIYLAERACLMVCVANRAARKVASWHRRRTPRPRIGTFLNCALRRITTSGRIAALHLRSSLERM